MNATRHGLRSLEPVVLGEDPETWASHREAVLEDLAPQGTMETALAELVASKLFRLGRVVRHEADLIEVSQDFEEIRRAVETQYRRPYMPGPADIPDLDMVEAAGKKVERIEGELKELKAGVRLLKGLEGNEDSKKVPEKDWPGWTLLLKVLNWDEDRDPIFEGEEVFVVGHVRRVLKKAKAKVEEVLSSWGTVIEEQEGKLEEARSAFKETAARYEAALERQRRGRSLPGPDDLEKIQRYEAHLERGLFRTLSALRELQEARGAVAPRPPAMALAVVHSQAAVGSFGGETVLEV